LKLTFTAITKEIAKEAYREIKEEQKDEDLTFSSCSESRLKTYLVRLHVGFEVGDNSLLPATAVEFEPFQWIDGEDNDTPRARDHL
jgi:hypothetical protein